MSAHGVRPGPTNTLVDVAGLRVGHAQRVGDGARTGVTVVLPPPAGAVAGVDVRGAAPGTRETDLLDPTNLVQRVHAVVLAGGSAYGLAAATGVVDRLAYAGVGFPVGQEPGQVVPIVPGAVLFDLGRGGTFRATPYAALGTRAYDAATADAVAQGSVGAGAGAVAGGLAGGVGSASAVLPDGRTVAALVIVNASGSPLHLATGELYGARYALDGELGLRTPAVDEASAWRAAREQPPEAITAGPRNTTVGVVGTDAALTKAQCAKLAAIAHDGIARALNPAHTMFDGDTIFALATGAGEAPDPVAFQPVLVAGADCVSRAIAHAVLAASAWEGAPSYRAAFPSAVG